MFVSASLGQLGRWGGAGTLTDIRLESQLGMVELGGGLVVVVAVMEEREKLEGGVVVRREAENLSDSLQNYRRDGLREWGEEAGVRGRVGEEGEFLR